MQSARKIAVTGATGRVGRHVVDVLEDQGHDVVPISRSNGVDVITGEGLAEALAGVESVVDAATQPLNDRTPRRRSSRPRPTTCRRPARMPACSGSWWSRSWAPTGSRVASSRPRPCTSRRCSRGRSRCGSCARRSSTSSSRRWWSGARRATWSTCRECAPSSWRPGASPRRSPAWRPLGKWAGARRRSRPRDRRPAGGAARRGRETARLPARRAAARRGGERPGRPGPRAPREALLPGSGCDSRRPDVRGMARRRGPAGVPASGRPFVGGVTLPSEGGEP